MNQETANYIMQRMSKYLDNSQMIKLKDSLDESLRQSEDGILEKSSQELLDMFLATKRLEGRSEKTLFLYRFNIEKMLEKSDKNVCVMDTDDIRAYLSSYQEQNGVSKATVDNVRRNLSSFFKWLEDENYIFKSPLRRIHKIKTSIPVRETYADEELEKLRDDCRELRNLAIIDVLNSTGIRVGELVNLDIDAQRIPAYRDKCFAVQDYYAAIENMLLAIEELGYRSCWYEGHITDDDRIGDKIAKILNVPEEYDLVCILPVGIAENAPGAPRKKEFNERGWFNFFYGKK